MAATILLAVTLAIHPCQLHCSSTMSSRCEQDFLTSILPVYRASRAYRHPTTHENNVAFLEASHIRRLSPVPYSFLARCGLTPSFPLHPVRFSSSVHTELATNGNEFYHDTHVSFAEFTLLHTYLHDSLLLTRTHQDSTSPHLHPMPTHLTTSDQLLLWLFYLAADRTSQLSLYFGHLHPTTIFRYVDHVTFCINDILSTSISWPTASERELLHGMMSVNGRAIAVLDGTHCQVQAPNEYNYTYYSGYKHKHTQNYLVCVNYLGMILGVDGPHPGRMNDREVYNLSDLSNNPDEYLSEDEVILADGGFIGGPGLSVPIHKNTYDRMTNADTIRVMMDYNKEFTANRLIVEDVFGWLKARACVLDKAWPRHLDKQANIFNAACKLHNFVRMMRIDYGLQQPTLNVNQLQ